MISLNFSKQIFEFKHLLFIFMFYLTIQDVQFSDANIGQEPLIQFQIFDLTFPNEQFQKIISFM